MTVLQLPFPLIKLSPQGLNREVTNYSVPCKNRVRRVRSVREAAHSGHILSQDFLKEELPGSTKSDAISVEGETHFGLDSALML